MQDLIKKSQKVLGVRTGARIERGGFCSSIRSMAFVRAEECWEDQAHLEWYGCRQKEEVVPCEMFCSSQKGVEA